MDNCGLRTDCGMRTYCGLRTDCDARPGVVGNAMLPAREHDMVPISRAYPRRRARLRAPDTLEEIRRLLLAIIPRERNRLIRPAKPGV
jgi:hypothetical protein